MVSLNKCDSVNFVWLVRIGGNKLDLHLVDCLDVFKSLSDSSVDLIAVDPPYGARRPSQRRESSERFKQIKGNLSVNGDFLIDSFRVVKDGGAIYLFSCWDRFSQW